MSNGKTFHLQGLSRDMENFVAPLMESAGGTRAASEKEADIVVTDDVDENAIANSTHKLHRRLRLGDRELTIFVRVDQQQAALPLRKTKGSAAQKVA